MSSEQRKKKRWASPSLRHIVKQKERKKYITRKESFSINTSKAI
jgi:hypothetical protein